MRKWRDGKWQMIGGTPAPLNYRRPSTFFAACPGCGRTFLPAVFARLASLARSATAGSRRTVAGLLAALLLAERSPDAGGGQQHLRLHRAAADPENDAADMRWH